MVPFRVYLITDQQNYSAQILKHFHRVAQLDGVGIQLREKKLSPRQLFDSAGKLQNELASNKPFFGLINDRADIALSLNWSGVHLREDSLPLRSMSKLLRQSLLVGCSVHDMDGALQAQDQGADFVTLGPIFPTRSKIGHVGLGLDQLAQICTAISIPVFALGGVNVERAKSCLEAGAYGLSVISAVWDAPDPRLAVLQLLECVMLHKGRRVTHLPS